MECGLTMTTKGNPMGAVCKLDGNTVMFGYPDSTVDAVAVILPWP